MRNKQLHLEQTQAMASFDSAINAVVKATDISSLVDKYADYMKVIDSTESSHKEFHIELLKSVVPHRAIEQLLRTLVKESITNHSYIDRNVVASKIGKKLLPKSVKGTPINRTSVALSLGLNLINIAAHMNLCSYRALINKDKHHITTLVINDNLVQQALVDAYHNVRASSFMVCVPTPHTPSKPGGTLLTPKTQLNSSGFNSVKTQSQSVCDAINALQDVPYRLRTSLTNGILEQYKVQDKWFNERGQFMTGEWSKFIADMRLAQEVGTFYFPVACDDRGRMYETSAYIKYQGDKFQKSMLEFADKQHCTDEGLTYLAIAIVNELHSDKIEFNDAVAWFDSHTMEELQAMAVGNPIAETLVADYIDAEDGKPIGTITHWDATNSGLQFYALLGADRQTASLCNVFDTGVIADAYKALATALNKATGTDSFNRSNVKNAFMVFLYGSMAKNILYKIEDKKNGVTNGIAEFFPADWSEEMMWTSFTNAMEEIAPAAITLMNLIYSYNIEGQTKFCWTMPDGYKVETTSTVSYSDADKQIRGWFLDTNGKTHEGHTSVILEEYNKFSRSLAPNVIHSVDAYFGREVIRRLAALGIQVSFIHDSFGVHPNHAATLHQTVREVAADIVNSNLLVDILSQINHTQTEWNIKKGRLTKGNLTRSDVLNSAYMVR